MVSRGLIAVANAVGKVQRLQLRLRADEVKDDVEHVEPYGFTSHPLPGAEHVTLFLDGDRSNGVTVVVGDRRYRMSGLPTGAVALYDCVGSSVVLDGAGGVDVVAAAGINLQAPLVTITGDLRVAGNIFDLGRDASLADMRDDYNAHRHAGGATTDRPA